MNINLIAHNIISIISTISLFGIAFFTYLNGPRKTANVTWTLMMLATAIFTISHVIGVNISNPNTSRIILMFNLCIFFIGSFNLHAVMYLIDKSLKNKKIIVFVHIMASVFTIFFIIFPELYLVNSTPKMYFPNYYESGPLNWTRVVFLYGIIVPYIVYLLIKSRSLSKSVIERNQHYYFILTIIIGYALGFIPNFLVYDIPINPLWGMAFTIVFMIPFTYGAIKYNLFSVKVIAIEAFLYSGAVVIIGGIIILLNYIDKLIQVSFPGFPTWLNPLISALLAVTFAVTIWKNLRKNDILKYEFITTVTHKFRTPLTHIKWAAENLSTSKISPDDRMQVEYIQNANTKLVELTNLLVNVSETENKNTDYKIEKRNLSELIEYVADSLINQSFSKHIKISKNITPNLIANFDDHRIRFVTQTIIENAINYTTSGGNISVLLFKKDSMITCSVTDSGIGIPAEEINFLFSKFYRGKLAKTTDTEGMGIGLYMSKEIIEHHHGKIWAESNGLGKGSTFSFSIPAIS